MKDRKQTQVIQWKEGKVPVSIKLGRVFLTIGAILFLSSSVFSLGSWITRFVGHWVDFGPELKNFFPELSFWEKSTDLFGVVSDGFTPAICVAMFLSGIGAFSYLKDRGPFIDWVSWAAIIGLGLLLWGLFSALRSLVFSTASVERVFLDSFSPGIDIIFYSVGWFLAKNWLD